jgi:cupin fold WbuC family metalloprotein
MSKTVPFFTMAHMIKIDSSFTENVLKKARLSSRKRSNYNFHKTYDALIQRMLNAAEPGTYVRPHKHENPDKTEIFVILSGKAVAVEFDQDGNPVDHMILSHEEGCYAVEIPPKVWHSFITLEPDTVLYEGKEGPYNKDVDKNFASWAPEEGSPEAQKFNAKVLKQLKISG